jgi:hypothetical protein
MGEVRQKKGRLGKGRSSFLKKRGDIILAKPKHK